MQKYGSEYQVRKRITEVGNHLKTMYSHHSLPVIIDVKILRAKFMDEKVLITGDNRDWFGQEAAKKVKAGIWPKADTYILLGPNNKDGFYGVANGGWELNGGVCSTNVAKKVSINWYEASTYKTRGYSDDLLTALVILPFPNLFFVPILASILKKSSISYADHFFRLWSMRTATTLE